MIVIGAEIIQKLIAGTIHEAKMVFNDRGAIVFPASTQHRDMKAEGISYEDDYMGDALAAMLRHDSIEIRFHQHFTDVAVARMVGALLQMPEFAPMAQAHVTYQGRSITI